MLRNTSIASALAVACLVLGAASARADNMTVKDSTGTTRTVCTKTQTSVEHPCHLMEGAFDGVPVPIKVGSDGTVATDALTSTQLSAAALATASAQASGNTKLDAIIAALGAPLTVTMSGIATAALQGTGNASLSSIDSKLTGVASAANQATANASLSSIDGKATTINTKLDTLHADLIASTPAGTNIVGDVGSASFSATCSVLTLPGTGGTFATGDLVANSATAGSVTPLTCSLARYSGGPVTITKAQIVTSTTGLANASFRGHVYTASPTVTNGNDGAFLSTQSGHFCRLDITVDQAFSNGASGSGAPITGSTCTRVLSATQTVHVLVEARAAYAWTAGQTLTVTLEGVN